MSAMWGGRFAGKLDPFFAQFNKSTGVDHRLLTADVLGSIAWARGLGKAGVLKAGEVRKLVGGLRKILGALASIRQAHHSMRSACH